MHIASTVGQSGGRLNRTDIYRESQHQNLGGGDCHLAVARKYHKRWLTCLLPIEMPGKSQLRSTRASLRCSSFSWPSKQYKRQRKRAVLEYAATVSCGLIGDPEPDGSPCTSDFSPAGLPHGARTFLLCSRSRSTRQVPRNLNLAGFYKSTDERDLVGHFRVSYSLTARQSLVTA